MNTHKIIYTDKDGKKHELYYPIMFSKVSCEHTNSEEVASVLPNCTNQGYVKYFCGECGNNHFEYINALGHDWDGWIITKKPTETEEGEKRRECLRDGCGYYEVVQIPVLVNFIFTLLNNGKYSVKGTERLKGSIAVPSTYEGVAVIKIDDYAFLEINSKITKVAIPSGITSIGKNAFDRCSKLVEVNIPDTVDEIGDYAFNGCSSLKEIDLNKGATSIVVDSGAGYTVYKLAIGKGMFGNCRSLTNVYFPTDKTITIIDKGAFEGCISLENISLPHTIKEINDNAFAGCYSLKTLVNSYLSVLPDSLTYIGYKAFAYCYSLEKLTIPKNVTNIEQFAFYGCKNLTIKVAIGNERYRIKDGNLMDTQTGLSLFVNPGATKISSDATAIGSGACSGKTFSAPIKIPLSVTTINSLAFAECENLVLHVEAESKPEGWADDWCDDSVTVVWGYKDGSCNHSYGGWVTTSMPTCTRFGSMERTCSICGNVDVEAIEPLGHDYETVVTEPTCEDEGYTTYTCKRCDHSYVDDFVPSNGHDMDAWVVVRQPNCTTEGLRRKTCQACGLVEEEKMPPIAGAHKYHLHANVPSTCTEGGYVTMKCDVCGYEDTQYKEALGHQMVNGTCTAPKTCSVCGATEGEALGHDWGEWATTQYPTCESEGVFERACKRCGEKESQPITALGHIWLAPTCTTPKTCGRCGATEGEPLGHTPSDWIVDTEATETAEGSKHKECTRCGIVLETATIPKLDNNTYLVTESGEYLTDEQGNLLIL